MTAVRFNSVSKRFTLRHERARTFQEAALNLLRLQRVGGGEETFWALRDVSRNVTALRRGSDPAAYYDDRPEWAHYLEVASWLRRNAGPTDVAMARRHFALYVYSGRYADKYRFDTTEEELAYLTSGSARKYVVEDAFDYLRGDFAPLQPALRSRGGDLILRYETPAPRVRVWELVRPR